MAHSVSGFRTSAIGILLCTVSLPALAQADDAIADAPVAEANLTASDDDQEVRLKTVVVEGERQEKGKALSEIEPDLVFTRDDIESLGASTFAEVLEIIEQETSSGRGQTSG
ncbi:MAG: hypothetical protein AAFX02_11855, partial [Pseudomonadota bacterium]